MLTKNMSYISFGVGEYTWLFLNHFTKGDKFCHFLFASWSEKNSKKGITIKGKVFTVFRANQPSILKFLSDF